MTTPQNQRQDQFSKYFVYLNKCKISSSENLIKNKKTKAKTFV